MELDIPAKNQLGTNPVRFGTFWNSIFPPTCTMRCGYSSEEVSEKSAQNMRRTWKKSLDLPILQNKVIHSIMARKR